MVEYLDGTKQLDSRSGYTTPGWYYWDETSCYCSGPYDSREQALAALKRYADNL